MITQFEVDEPLYKTVDYTLEKQCESEKCANLCAQLYYSRIGEFFFAMCVDREDFCQCALPKPSASTLLYKPPVVIYSMMKCCKFLCATHCQLVNLDFGICLDNDCVCFEGLNHNVEYDSSLWYRLLEYEEIFHKNYTLNATSLTKKI